MLFNVMLFNAMFNAMRMLFKKEKYKLGRQSVLEILYTVEITYWAWTTIYICIYKRG